MRKHDVNHKTGSSRQTMQKCAKAADQNAVTHSMTSLATSVTQQVTTPHSGGNSLPQYFPIPAGFPRHFVSNSHGNLPTRRDSRRFRGTAVIRVLSHATSRRRQWRRHGRGRGRGLYANVDQSPLTGRRHVTHLDQSGPYDVQLF